MIAADTSSLIAYYAGEIAADTIAIDEALAHRALALPPVVLTELLSATGHTSEFEALLLALPLLEPLDGYWMRAGRLRAALLKKRRKARLADILIAQTCLDHHVALITRDRDFRHMAHAAQLRLLP